MSSTRRFDYADYLRGFRAACAQRGINPVLGATGYQVVHFTAEQRRRSLGADRWWMRHDLWIDYPPYHSEVEQDALWHLFRDTYLLARRRDNRERRFRRGAMALRDLHQCQRRRIS